MKELLLVLNILLISILSFAQTSEDLVKIKQVAQQFLNSISNQLIIPSELISNESLNRNKEMNLSMAFEYDSTGNSNSMMLLPGNKLKEMTSAKVWDYMQRIAQTMEKSKTNLEWNFEDSEIKKDLAFVKYKVKDRETKIMQLRKEEGNWKVILSFNSIF